MSFLNIFGKVPASVALRLVSLFFNHSIPLVNYLKPISSNLLDLSCVVWQNTQDGREGSCFVYDNTTFIQAFSYFREFSPKQQLVTNII